MHHFEGKIFKINILLISRLGKLACPRVNDDQKVDVDAQKLNSGRPHDYWILESLFYNILLIFPIFLLLCKKIALRTTRNVCGRPVFESWLPSDDQIFS